MVKTTQHGIEDAFYAFTPLGQKPFMLCSCGFETSRGNDTWAETGEELDEHLKKAAG